MDRNKQTVIDMGSSRISVMATEILKNGEVRILSEESKKTNDIKYGVVEQHTEAAHTITRLTRLLQNSARIPEIQKLCVSLNAKTMKEVSVRVHKPVANGRVITEELLTEMKQDCIKKFDGLEVDIFKIIPLYYDIDYQKTNNPVGSKADEITGYYNVIVGSVYIKKEIYRCFERTITRETTITPEPYFPLGVEALSTVLLDDEERQNGCALINFGAMTTTLAIYAEGVLQQLIVVGLGGLHITRDIQELGINEARAEKLKCLKGSALKRMVTQPVRIQVPGLEENNLVKIDTDFLATIIEARLSEITSPLFQAIHETPFALNSGIIITGGGSKLNDIIDFIEERAELPVRYGDHSDWLCDDTDERFYDPTYSQLIGTAVLLHEFQLKHPDLQSSAQSGKGDKNDGKNPKIKFTDKIASGITNKILKLFEDENYLK